jgi:cobalt-zinc-cadmium efflux system outer membrane protein
MVSRRHPASALAWAFAALSGCANLPAEQGYREASELVETRLGTAPRWSEQERPPVPEIPATPVSSAAAIQLAFANNPRVRSEFARLGLGRAELEEARRVSNPTFGYTRLRPESGSGALITQSLSIGLSDLLLLASRKRFAAGELVRLQQEVAAALIELAVETEVAWFEAASARQIAAMRDLVATSAEASAELAQRFLDAGNISRLQLEQELAAAAQARIAAVRARAQARRARADLAGLIGLPVEGAWSLRERLPAPPVNSAAPDDLVSTALAQRLDLAAARQEVALRETTLGVARRWRWLGSTEVGFEREREVDGTVLRGPTLSFELPIFNQGQAAIARGRAELDGARARLDAQVLAVSNEARIGLERMATARDISESYRTVLLPRREAIVARSQEEVNFMLIGVFELIQAKQQQYDAYQEYLESVRDYWTARAKLRHAVGGALPDDAAMPEATIGVDAVLPDASAPAMDHSKMDHSKMSMPMDQDGGAPMDPSTQKTADDPETPEPAPHQHGDSP